MDMFCWNTHKQHKRDFPHIKRRCSSFELRQMAVQQYIKSPTTIISRLDRPTSGVLPIVLGHRLAKTTLWWHGWMIGLGIDGWLEGWIMVYEIAFPPGNLKHPLKKCGFNRMIPSLYMGIGCFTKHPLQFGCFGFQAYAHDFCSWRLAAWPNKRTLWGTVTGSLTRVLLFDSGTLVLPEFGTAQWCLDEREHFGRQDGN